MDDHLRLKEKISPAIAALLFLTPSKVLAEPPTGLLSQIDGLAAWQGTADLSGSGSFSANRAFVRASSIYSLVDGNSIGVSASFGQFDYEFDGATNQPWTDIRDVRFSLPVRFSVGDSASVFLAPQVRWDFQSGVSASDGQTEGFFAAVAWKISESLTIGPAFGAFTQLEDSSINFFPALLVDWDINEKWNLNTGSGIGATQGPGLTLSYDYSNTVSFSLSARSEKIRFRLDSSGLAPDGIGEDQSIPVVLSLDYKPSRNVSLSVFAGAEFSGELALEDARGNQISRQTYDTAPIAGLAFRARF